MAKESIDMFSIIFILAVETSSVEKDPIIVIRDVCVDHQGRIFSYAE